MKKGGIERLATLVKAVGLAILGQAVSDLRPRDAKQVLQSVFILLTIEPPEQRPSIVAEGRFLRGNNRLREPRNKCPLPCSVGPAPTFGRHLTRAQAVMHLDPDGLIRGIVWVKRQAGQIKLTFFVYTVVATRAVVADKGFVRRDLPDRSGWACQNLGQHRQSEKATAGWTPQV